MPSMQPLIQEVTEDYARVKRVLDKARHPTFIGGETVKREASSGGVLVWTMDCEDVAVSIVSVRRSCLLALSVLRPCEGIGSRVLAYIRPNWARVITDKVAWFEKNGYTRVGQPMQARKLATQIMVRNGLSALGERVRLIQ